MFGEQLCNFSPCSAYTDNQHHYSREIDNIYQHRYIYNIIEPPIGIILVAEPNGGAGEEVGAKIA